MKIVHTFVNPLIEGIIIKRNSQFTMDVLLNNETIRVHCPTTGRIGDIDLAGVSCLLSKSNDAKRKTPYTVEAVSLNLPTDKKKSWIGINQIAINRYVESAIKQGFLKEILKTNNSIQREVVLGNSKLDFLVDDNYIEVKTPIMNLQVDYPAHIKTKKSIEFNSADRLIKHINELSNSLESHKRAILLTCFMYDNKRFNPGINSTKNDSIIKSEVNKCISNGLEIWQVNFSITPEKVVIKEMQNLTQTLFNN